MHAIELIEAGTEPGSCEWGAKIFFFSNNNHTQ